ncbi:hypothetical protein ACPPVS_12660 [Cellulomonas sp. McL0617]|uniref:hypothetical protein n=1 Tax=Cellulomonas sp. McL0617 TaxID=3415675 RepID=UPI003CF37449
MPTYLVLTYLTALLTTTRTRIRAGTRSDVGASTLELVIIILGLMAIATMLVVAVTAAVQRRVDQIN